MSVGNRSSIAGIRTHAMMATHKRSFIAIADGGAVVRAPLLASDGQAALEDGSVPAGATGRAQVGCGWDWNWTQATVSKGLLIAGQGYLLLNKKRDYIFFKVGTFYS